MNFFNQIRTKIHGSLLRKKRPTFPVDRNSVSLKSARSIGILFDGSDPKDREIVLKYANKLESEGKKIKLLAFFDNDLKSENFTYSHFNKKQLDWALRPKLKTAEEFAQQPFDLLINLSQKTVLPIDYIAAHSKARFRVGPSTAHTFCYDLMIEHSPKKDLQFFINQIEQYLQAMQPGTLAKAV